MPERELVHTDLREHVLTLTMDRPEARNALSRQMITELAAAFQRLEEDDDCWVGVLQAEGPTFCAGADLKEALHQRDGGDGPSDTDTRHGGFDIMARRKKPVIACVEGQAFAGGLEIILSCDLVVASTDSTFALFEVTRGLLAIGGGLFRLPRALPRNIALEMILTGQPKSAGDMLAHGLLNRVAPPGATRHAARELALLIARNSPLAVQAALEVAGAAIADTWTDAEGWAGQRGPAARVRASADLVEGLRAFTEKRTPAWTGN